MRYYKNVETDHITAIGIGPGGTEITQEEYNNIMSIIRNRPVPEEGCDYKLKIDLTWELYKLPPEPADPDITSDEALSIIVGGDF